MAPVAVEPVATASVPVPEQAAPLAVAAPAHPEDEETEPVVIASPLPHAPQVIASFAPPPATYQVVSEHAGVEEEPHRPVRRRRHASESEVAAEPLQLVETAAEAAAVQPAFEDELPRRPVRRRRQSQSTASPAEPLQLVETAPGAAAPEAGAPQA